MSACGGKAEVEWCREEPEADIERTVQAKLFSRGAVEGVKVVAIVGPQPCQSQRHYLLTLFDLF